MSALSTFIPLFVPESSANCAKLISAAILILSCDAMVFQASRRAWPTSRGFGCLEGGNLSKPRLFPARVTRDGSHGGPARDMSAKRFTTVPLFVRNTVQNATCSIAKTCIQEILIT